MGCGNITQGFQLDCSSILQPGLEPRIVLMNQRDIASVTITNNVITDITLKGGTQAYLFETTNKGIQARYEASDIGLTAGYIHEVQFQIHDISSTQKEEVRNMALNKLTAIVFNMPAPGNEDGYFEVFGLNAGMETLETTRVNRGETAAFQITLNTGDNTRESKLPYNFFDTDYNTTLEKILALLNLGVGFPYTFPFVLS